MKKTPIYSFGLTKSAEYFKRAISLGHAAHRPDFYTWHLPWLDVKKTSPEKADTELNLLQKNSLPWTLQKGTLLYNASLVTMIGGNSPNQTSSSAIPQEVLYR